MSALTLYDYWRSSAAYRVRIALNLKGLAYAQHAVDLRADAHRQTGYTDLNPQGLVPTLRAGDATIIQSPAILEWIEETHPQPPLLPADAADRAIVRGMAALIGCDIHPLNNLRVQRRLRSDFSASEPALHDWIACWIDAGFRVLEARVAQYGGRYAFGDTPTFADCYLVPQVYSARRFGVDLTCYPRLIAAAETAGRMEPFAQAHPDRQPDADRS